MQQSGLVPIPGGAVTLEDENMRCWDDSGENMKIKEVMKC